MLQPFIGLKSIKHNRFGKGAFADLAQDLGEARSENKAARVIRRQRDPLRPYLDALLTRSRRVLSHVVLDTTLLFLPLPQGSRLKDQAP